MQLSIMNKVKSGELSIDGALKLARKDLLKDQTPNNEVRLFYTRFSQCDHKKAELSCSMGDFSVFYFEGNGELDHTDYVNGNENRFYYFILIYKSRKCHGLLICFLFASHVCLLLISVPCLVRLICTQTEIWCSNVSETWVRAWAD